MEVATACPDALVSTGKSRESVLSRLLGGLTDPGQVASELVGDERTIAPRRPVLATQMSRVLRVPHMLDVVGDPS